MKNVLMILMIIPWAFLSTQSALAKSPERFTSNDSAISAGLTNAKYENDSAKPSSANADSQSVNDKEAKAGNSSLFPYLFYALSIIGLLAVLSFDTSGNARSKRKSHPE